ncbi:ASCH domain-containing protein [Streptomyces sp. NBC_00239]|uniref:ASCH domain-containing protein n=1 Tax=Streptomyces sp. NBC_00239 TaxID=2903640 RepID=UPI002E2CAE94|nr:ASCH domain-containing protein [Streptomyces sp. NBC_00239]
MWPRVKGMRALELGSVGAMRERLNSLVLAGEKLATTGLFEEYRTETEGLEYVGEQLALLDNSGEWTATVEITGVEVTSFGEVTWAHAAAEGEGDASLAEWRAGHQRFWAEGGTPVEDGTAVVCLTFRLVETAAPAAG